MAVMRALWAEPHVVFNGRYHTLPNAGINPLPTKPLDIWLGGGVDATYDRIGRLGDGWLNIYHGPKAFADGVAKIRAAAVKAGRDPEAIGLESWVGMGGDSTPADWRTEIEQWRGLGVSHITLNTVFNRGHIKPIQGQDAATHLRAMETYRQEVGDLFA